MTKKKHPGGRPTKMTEAVVEKLQQAFAFGCTDLEACLFADISKDCLYNYQKKYPKFVERKQLLKENPVLQARKSVVNDLEHNPDLALKYLERKKKDEFSLRHEHSHEIVSLEEIVKRLEGVEDGSD